MWIVLKLVILFMLQPTAAWRQCNENNEKKTIFATNSWMTNVDADRSDVGHYFPGNVYRKLTSYDVHHCSLICEKDPRCKSFNYIENDYICHINEKDRASSDPPDEDLYQFRGRWVPRIKGLIEMKDSTYYSRDYYQLKKKLTEPCVASSCSHQQVCSPGVPQHTSQDTPTCQKYKFSLKDFYVNWSVWSAWGACSVTCSKGTQVRNRTCDEGKRRWMCQGESRQARICERDPCPHWATWGTWNGCVASRNCGTGERFRTRTCLYSITHTNCVGSNKQTQTCLLPSCTAAVKLSQFTHGYVFIYDDSDPTKPSWKGVCKSSALTTGDKKKLSETTCKQIGLDFGFIVDDVDNGLLTEEIYLQPLNCEENEKFLIRCEHDGWKLHEECRQQLRVYCYGAVHLTLPENEVTYELAESFCETQSKQLCSHEEIFPFNNIPIITGDYGTSQWVPIRDLPNDWAQIGSAHNNLGHRHSEHYRSPQWGLSERDTPTPWKGEIFCCTVSPPRWASWSSWSVCSSRKNCQNGFQERTRICLHSDVNPSCEGSGFESRPCLLPSCEAPHTLSNGTFGALLIYDDSIPESAGWKGVCQSSGLSEESKRRILKTVCRKFGTEFGTLVSQTKNLFSDQIYFQLLNCREDEEFLMRCEHDGWMLREDCEQQLHVSCYHAQHYNRSGFPISYDSASKFCGARNMRLCSKQEIVPFGNTPIITGATGEDHWTPISDRYNDWLQVGGIDNRLGRSHIDLYGAPYWGLIAHSRTSLKDHLFCCTERLTAFPPASCAGVDERRNGSYVISPKPDDVLPFSVKCAFGTITETIIEHHMMEETMMTSCAAACYTPVLNYEASIEQIISLMNRSVECRQFIKYRCRGAMLLLDLRSSWISRDGEKMKYWGGATSRRTGYCACGETGTCVNNAYKCNCDINQNKLETSDEGYLNDTSALPVKRLKVGDTDYSLEAAWYTVGPLICTEDEPTTINHDSMNEIEVTTCSGRKCFKRVINYDITIEEIGALIDQSFECKQFIKYRCIASKFLEGYASWLSRNGSEMTFWGGSTSQRPYYCACGETGSCLNNNWKCNCDANLNVETFDEGYLTDKTLLPVTEVRFGDTDSPTESGWFTLGPLVCNGRVQQGEPEVGWYAPSNGYQYILISTTQSWFESRQTCQEMGGDLAVAGAKDLTMRRKIVDQLSIPGLSGAWIGMTDMDEEGTWLWLNGVAVSNPHWYTTEPNGLANENCAILSYSNLSKDYALDVNCEAALFRGICEKRIF